MKMQRAAAVCLMAGTLVMLAAACERGAGETVHRPPPRTNAGASVDESTSPHTAAPDGVSSSAEPALPARDAAAVVVAPDDEEPAQDLVGEQRERNLVSDTVKIKVVVGERYQAHVVWGRKDFGIAPLEIERPRNSGPLDLVVIAPGYLPYHARAFTDRDDTISVRLYSAAEAPQLLGYRASDVPAPPASAATGSTPASNQNRQKTPEKAPKKTR